MGVVQMASAVLLTAACGLQFNLRPDHIVSRAPAIRMTGPSEFQVSQAVSDPTTGRRAVLCAFSAWAFGTMTGTAAAMADETDEAEAAR